MCHYPKEKGFDAHIAVGADPWLSVSEADPEARDYAWVLIVPHDGGYLIPVDSDFCRVIPEEIGEVYDHFLLWKKRDIGLRRRGK